MSFLLLVACVYHPDTEDGDDAGRMWEELPVGGAEVEVELGDSGPSDDGRWHDGDRAVWTADADGWIALAMTEVQEGAPAFTLYVDGEWVTWEGLDLEDRDLDAWVGVGAGHEYVIEVDRVSCVLDVEFTAVEDTWEPNNDADGAGTLSGPAEGWFHAGEIGELASSDDFADWYRYVSDGSPFTVSLTEVPAEIEGFVQVWDAGDTEWSLAWESARDGGDDVVVEVEPDHAGAYLVEVRPYGAETRGLGDPPAALTQAYTLTVEER